MNYTRHLESPDHFHFWAGIATIAGALRGKVWIDMEYWKWRPNFFIIFVAPPGVATKSTTIGVGQSFLRRIEGVHFGPDSGTWQGVTDALMESTENVTMPDGEVYRMSAITMALSEIGTFFDPQNREMVDMLVDLWDGREVPWKRRTRHQGIIEIPNPWFNLVGACTPSWLNENFPEYAVKGGFTSRTVFIFASHKRHFVAYPKLFMEEGDRDLELRLVNDLNEIAQIAGEYELSPEAYEWGDEWYRKHWEGLGRRQESDRLSGYRSRKQTHIHKLALVLCAARKSERIIEPEDLQNALGLIEAIEGDMLKVFQTLSDSPAAKNAQQLMLVLKMNPKGIGKRAIWRQLIHHMSEWEFNNAINGALSAGYISMRQNGDDVLLCPTEAALGLRSEGGTDLVENSS